jgi:hypothetical protein
MRKETRNGMEMVLEVDGIMTDLGINRFISNLE